MLAVCTGCFTYSAFAAFPQPVAEGGNLNASDTTTHTVNVGSPTSGQLSLLNCGIDNGVLVTWSDDYIELLDVDPAVDANNRLKVAYKIADGTEGVSITMTSSESQQSNCHWMTIEDFDPAQAPQIAAAHAGSTATHDPPELTPTGGAKDYLWIAVSGMDGTVERTISTYPTSYLNTGTADGGSANTELAWGRRELNAAAENPSAFIWSGNGPATAVTIAIHPNPAPAGITLTSIGTGSPCEQFNTALEPDIAIGDILVPPGYPSQVTSPGGYPVTIGEDCQFSYTPTPGDNSFQSLFNVAIWDDSIGDYHAEDIDYSNNNVSPVCDEELQLVLLEATLMTDVDLTTVCTDANGHALTFSGTPPTGMSLSGTNNETLGGTPSTSNYPTPETDVLTATDPAEATGTTNLVTHIVGASDIVMTDITGGSISAAFVAEEALFPWRDEAEISFTFQCDESVAAGILISQDPVATTVLAIDEQLSAVVSTGECGSGGGGPRMGIRIGIGL